MFLFANYALDRPAERRRRSVQPAGRQLRPRGGVGTGRRRAAPHRQRDGRTRRCSDGFRLGATTHGDDPARRYNITTGRDDNGDTVFNDRPAGVGRNSALTKGMWDVAARLSYAFGFGERPGDRRRRRRPDGDRPARRSGGPAAPATCSAAMVRRRRREQARSASSCIVSASNLFNTVNPIGYSGVMTSPFFGAADGGNAGPQTSTSACASGSRRR